MFGGFPNDSRAVYSLDFSIFTRHTRILSAHADTTRVLVCVDWILLWIEIIYLFGVQTIFYWMRSQERPKAKIFNLSFHLCSSYVISVQADACVQNKWIVWSPSSVSRKVELKCSFQYFCGKRDDARFGFECSRQFRRYITSALEWKSSYSSARDFDSSAKLFETIPLDNSTGFGRITFNQCSRTNVSGCSTSKLAKSNDRVMFADFCDDVSISGRSEH